MKRLLAAIALSLLLISGCSSTVTGAASYADAQATEIQTDTDTTVETPTDDSDTQTDDPSPTTTETSGDKPSKDDVHAAVVMFLQDSAVPAGIDVQSLATCITDEIYDDMSADGLDALVQDGVDGQVNDADYDVMEKAVADCVSQS